VPPLAAPFLAAAGLLALAGAPKLLRPAGTRQALRTQGLPGSVTVVRLLGLCEVAAAAAALAGTAAGAVAVAVAYAAFTGFVGLALLRGRPLSSCGCFAEPDLPPTWAHPVVTGGLAVIAAAVAAGDPAGLPQLLRAGAWTAAGTLASGALVGALAFVVLAELPRLVAAAVPAVPAVPARSPDPGPRPFSIPTLRSDPS